MSYANGAKPSRNGHTNGQRDEPELHVIGEDRGQQTTEEESKAQEGEMKAQEGESKSQEGQEQAQESTGQIQLTPRDQTDEQAKAQEPTGEKQAKAHQQTDKQVQGPTGESIAHGRLGEQAQENLPEQIPLEHLPQESPLEHLPQQPDSQTGTKSQEEGIETQGEGEAQTMSGQIDTSNPGSIPRRVKVYLLQGEDWLDNGTGYCVGEIEKTTKNPYFLVRNELDAEDIILKSFLEGSIQYQRQQETLIVWTDLSGKDLALSFQESEGCNDLCEFIIKMQQESLSPDISLYYVIPNSLEDSSELNENTDITEMITGPISYPPDPTTDNLGQVMEVFSQNANSKFTRRTLSTFVVRKGYIEKLVKVFETLEGETQESMLPKLYVMSDIVKTLVLFSESAIMEHILASDALVWGVLSILEYDSNYPKYKAMFREQYRQNEFRQIIEVTDAQVAMFRKDFFLTFFKDVVLVRFLDDAAFNMLSQMIYVNQVDIIEFVKEEVFLKRLFALYTNTNNLDNIEDMRNGVKMLRQYVLIAKNLQSFQKSEFFANLVKCGLFRMLSFALKDSENKIRVLGTELIVIIIEQDVSLVNCIDEEPSRREWSTADDHQVEHKHNGSTEKSPDLALDSDDTFVENKDLRLKLSDDMTLITILSNLLLEDKNPGLKVQAFEALKILLDSNIASPSGSSNASVANDDDNDDDNDINTKNYFSAFYSKVAPSLFRSLSELAQDPTDKAHSRMHEDVLLHQQLCDLVTYCAKEHETNIAQPFFLNNDVLLGVARLLEQDTRIVLKLSALRCLKNILLLNDDNYTEYIVQRGIFRYFFDFFAQHTNDDNLVNSTCLDLLEILLKNCDPSTCFRRHNYKLLVSHVYANYRAFLMEKIPYVGTGRGLVSLVEGGFLADDGVAEDSDELVENNKEIDTEQLSPGSDDYDVERSEGLKYKSPRSLFQNIDKELKERESKKRKTEETASKHKEAQ